MENLRHGGLQLIPCHNFMAWICTKTNKQTKNLKQAIHNTGEKATFENIHMNLETLFKRLMCKYDVASGPNTDKYQIFFFFDS